MGAAAGVERWLGERNRIVQDVVAMRRCSAVHLLPANILGFSGGKKNPKKHNLFFFGRNITRVKIAP